MNNILTILILTFGLASYAVGIREMLHNKYAPSVFSRLVWLLLAAISFASVLGSESSSASILLAGIFLAGNFAICLLSFWKGSKGVGFLEYICLALLVCSAIVWIVFDTPLVSLVISLFAHFVGGVPTYLKVWKDPSSESAGFWSLFFIASILSLVADRNEPLLLLIFPIYFVLFDGALTFLSMRKIHTPIEAE